MCGFISILGPDGHDVAPDILTGLMAIQHRGQDAAGLVTFLDTFRAKKGRGLVREVFAQKHLEYLRGPSGVGHVRYPTVGKGEDRDAQPFYLQFPIGISMAHNGNVTNFQALKRDFFDSRGIPLGSDCDLEAVLYVFADALLESMSGPRAAPEDVFAAVGAVFDTVQGAYSVVGQVAHSGMFAFRDPYGIKPIVLGKKELSSGAVYALASESVVLEVAGYELIRDLAAGEAVWVDAQRNVHSKILGSPKHRPCVFEYVYFARPDSILDGISVYRSRLHMGRKLAESWRQTGLEVDAVIPVPESACHAAQAMAEALGVPYREGFVKNRYVGRTFIMPNDAERVSSIRNKLNPIPMEFEGKRVLILDDSIVRGNTARQIVKVAREMGAAKVYLASYSPALIHRCPYGIDMSTRKEFIARDRTAQEVAEELGADHVLYQGLDEMVDAVRESADSKLKFCRACFDGCYPTGDVTTETLATIEGERLAAL